jgi:aryl-alcohol dehydrogenase-like predicted oxidoreductase
MKPIGIFAERTTAQLGFGCALLADRSDSLRLLACAIDAGVTHFDVAPSYGFGRAEDILGEFIVKRRAAVTVTTKVGLARPAAPGALALARSAVRPILAAAPGLRRRLGGGVYRMSVRRAQFGLDQVRRSLAESLERLRTDRVDVLLLHELTPEDITDELRRFAEDVVRSGQAGSCGVGSARPLAESIAKTYPDLTAVVQTNWSAADPPIEPANGRLTITHGALRRLDETSAWLRADPARLRRMADAAGADLSNDAELADCLLAAALAANRAGVVLMASRRLERVARAAAQSSNARRLECGARLATALSAELPARL